MSKGFTAYAQNVIAVPIEQESDTVIGKVISSNDIPVGSLILYTDRDARDFRFKGKDYHCLWSQRIICVEREVEDDKIN